MDSSNPIDGMGELLHHGTCMVVPNTSTNRDRLRSVSIIEEYPFSLYELSYVNPLRDKYNIYVPQAGALDAKRRTIEVVLGPLRMATKRPFKILSGGGYDPVWKDEQRQLVVSHRPSTRSHHQYMPWTQGTKAGRYASGTAIDFRPSNINERRDSYVYRLKEMSGAVLKEHGVHISIGVYMPGRGNFIHVDLRTGKKWRATRRPK